MNCLIGFDVAIAGTVAVDSLLQYGGRLEHHHATRRNGNFSTGFRVTADTLAFLADHERSERRQFYRLALFQAVGDLFQDQFDKSRRFRAREAYLLVDGFGQIHPCNCLSGSGHRLPQTHGEQYVSEIMRLTTDGHERSSIQSHGTLRIADSTLTRRLP